MEKLTRRTFVYSAGLAAAGLAGGMCGVAGASEAVEGEPQWDAETDVLVVGAGFAGISAAITVQKEGLGDVLVLEVAPEEEAGGNSRVCSQIVFSPVDVEGALVYQRNLNGDYAIEEPVLQTWADEMVYNLEWLEELGCSMEELDMMNPEFPEVEGGESAKCYLLEGQAGNSVLWRRLHEISCDLGASYEYGVRVARLISDPLSKEVLGVQAEDGKNYRARKGVVLACGGFENDPELLRTYYPVGYPHIGFYGSPWNRGDGIRLAQSVGAKLWHMNNFAGPYFGPKLVREEDKAPEFAEANLLSYSPLAFSTSKDFIYIGPDGKRYTNEDTARTARHGKVWVGGTYAMQVIPSPAWAIVGQQCYDLGAPVSALFPENGWANTLGLNPCDSNDGYLDAGVIVRCESAEDITEATGIPAYRIEETLATYNRYVEDGMDLDFHRGCAVYPYGTSAGDPDAVATTEAYALDPLTPPYYVFRYEGGILNTQGGPQRTEKGEVVDVFDQVIPRLYAAGELGTVYSYNYNGGGNVSDALASGRVAARAVAALEPWE